MCSNLKTVTDALGVVTETYVYDSMNRVSKVTDALGISTTLLGILLVVWNVWDFINDPLMGALMDKAFAKRQNKAGKFRPWLLRSTPLIAITCIVFFTLPTFFEGITLADLLKENQ